MRPTAIVSNATTWSDAEAIVGALFRTREARADPYPHYHRLRDLAPVHRSEMASGWLLTRYDDCRAAIRDPRLEKRYEEAMNARSSRWRRRPGLVWAGKTLLNLDGPAHARLRRRILRSFSPRSAERLRPLVEAMVDELLDPLADAGGGELMERLAFQLPVGVIGALLGMPRADLPPFRERILALTGVFEIGASSATLDAADIAAVECRDYFNQLVAEKRRKPDDDLLSQLVIDTVEDDDDPLDDEEINTLASLLFFAGFETTTNLIGNGVLALLDHPNQVALLRERPALCAGLAEELLRHSGPVQIVNRFTTEPVAFGETTIPAGEQVFPLLAAANRDPARYPDPDRLDVTRTDIRPLAFGGGAHYCLGAALARLEIDIAFRRLLDRFAVIELSGTRLPYRDRFSLRGPTTIPLILGTRAPRLQVPEAGPSSTARPGGDDWAWRSAFRRRLEDAPASLDTVALDARIGVLRRSRRFAVCTPGELASLAATAYPIAFDAGEPLCMQGGDCPDVYVISEGEASVIIDGVVVGTLGADDVAGELGLVEHRPRSATVLATTHMLTYAISRERFDELLRTNPRIARHLAAPGTSTQGPPSGQHSGQSGWAG